MALASNALTTVARLVRELKITAPASDSDDYAQLEDLIGEVSDAVESYCSRSFAKAERMEAVPAYDTDTIRLTHYPVLTVSEVLFNGAAVSAAEWSTTPAEEDAKAGLLRNLIGVWSWSSNFDSSAAPEKHPGHEKRLYTVTYAAGYVLPKDATADSPRTLPRDLERAVLLACVAEYRRQGRDPSISSESLLSASVSYATPSSDKGGGIIPDDAATLLDKYKRWA